MPLTRKITWESSEGLHGDLGYFLLERANAPFVWGVNDCCLLPADAIQAFTGVDIAADFRGKYTDEESAFALIRKVTGKGKDPATAVGDAAEYCATRAGMEEWHLPLFARRGDLVVIEESDRLIAGIVHLNGRYAITVGEKGLKRIPITHIRRAWKV